MLRTIEILPPDPSFASESMAADHDFRSPVIKRSALNVGVQAHDLLAQAHACAATLIAQAERDAVEIRAAGLRDGLQRGVCAALAPISAMIFQWEQVRWALREGAGSALRTAMDDLIAREPALLTLLDSILEVHFPEQSAKVRIRVPPGAESARLELKCKELGLAASIEVGEAKDEFSIAWNGHVWTAHLGEITDAALSAHARKAAELPAVDAVAVCRQALLEAAENLSDDMMPMEDC